MPDRAQMAPASSYDPAYFARLADIERDHFWFRARNRVIGSLVRQVTQSLPTGFRVLEVGCGTGNVLRMLEQECRGGTVLGMDLFTQGLHFARRHTSCMLVQGDIHSPPFRLPFDVIGTFDVLEHLADDLRVLRYLRAMLAPGGALLVTVPAHQSLWSYFDEASHHCRRYETGELATKLAEAGYKVEYLSQFMTCIYPIVWLGRRLAPFIRRRHNSVSGSREDDLARSELRIIPFLNRLLLFVLQREADLVARRLRMPLGTSIVAIARNAG